MLVHAVPAAGLPSLGCAGHVRLWARKDGGVWGVISWSGRWA